MQKKRLCIDSIFLNSFFVFSITENPNIINILFLLRSAYRIFHCNTFLLLLHSPAPKDFDPVWIGLIRTNPSDPTDAYFMWDVGGFLDASSVMNVYPFVSVDPHLLETEACAVILGWVRNSEYLLADIGCDYPSRFICEMIWNSRSKTLVFNPLMPEAFLKWNIEI